MVGVPSVIFEALRTMAVTSIPRRLASAKSNCPSFPVAPNTATFM